MNEWEELGMTQEEYEAAMDAADEFRAEHPEINDAYVSAMYIDHVADEVRRALASGHVPAELYAESVATYDELAFVNDEASSGNTSEIVRNGAIHDMHEIERMLKVRNRNEMALVGKKVAESEGKSWDDMLAKYEITPEVEAKPEHAESEYKVDYSIEPVENKERVAQREFKEPLPVKTQRQFESAHSDKRILNSIENGRSNPDFDFDEYDYDDDDMSLGE